MQVCTVSYHWKKVVNAQIIGALRIKMVVFYQRCQWEKSQKEKFQIPTVCRLAVVLLAGALFGMDS